jgi:ActR/RegA family two-component response regulator
MVETRSPRPVLLVVDDDAHALAKIERELSNRYGKGYRVVCVGSAEVGIVELERCEADGDVVALVLADG